MPLEFLRKKAAVPPPAAAPTPSQSGHAGNLMPEEVVAQEHQLRLNYAGKTSEGVRIKTGAAALSDLPKMLAGLSKSDVEVIEPLPIEFSQAAPTIARPSKAMQWLNAHHGLSPIARHALVVLESIDAVDLAFDTFVCGLLDGETDTSGYPEYNAVVGGAAAHWDEVTGDMIVRGVVGWGGRGVRGDTDRIGSRLLTSILSSILASQYALGLTTVARPMVATGRGGVVCAHCGFHSAHERAFYCRSAACVSSAADRSGAPKPPTMPIYDYSCSACRHLVEVIHGIHEAGPKFCPNCGVQGTMRKGFTTRRSISRGRVGPRRIDRRAHRHPDLPPPRAPRPARDRKARARRARAPDRRNRRSPRAAAPHHRGQRRRPGLGRRFMSMAGSAGDWVSLAEAAAILAAANVHFRASTIGAWARTGKLQSIKLGGRRFVRRGEVRALITPPRRVHVDHLQPGLFGDLQD